MIDQANRYPRHRTEPRPTTMKPANIANDFTGSFHVLIAVSELCEP
jgi:hypothetical protein